jgi:hypothetical protein
MDSVAAAAQIWSLRHQYGALILFVLSVKSWSKIGSRVGSKSVSWRLSWLEKDALDNER